jgi:hydrogenase maturation protease
MLVSKVIDTNNGLTDDHKLQIDISDQAPPLSGQADRILVYGYGNLGRKDDGLGVRCAQLIESWLLDMGIESIEVETTYQLNIEDTELISGYCAVFFIDASLEYEEAVKIEMLEPAPNIIEFSMHAMHPSYVLALCKEMFGECPKAWLVHIKGYDWDFEEGLSAPAQRNLVKAVELVKKELVALAT